MKADDLFDAIASFPALSAAARRAALGKRAKPGAPAFLANQEKEVLRLERELRSGRYRPGRYRTIEIFDPKHRVVSAAPFRDRVVHHAFCAVCEPVFERGFIHDSYANRKGKGTHRAVARYERFRDRFRYLEGRRLRLHPAKTLVTQTDEAATFLGICPAAGRATATSRRQRAPLSQPPARLAGPLARGYRNARRGPKARVLMDSPCRARRYLAPAPNHLSGRVVRAVPGAWPSP